TSMIVAVVGAFTAILAASIALVQNDIKRVLAYSTVSQLGFMFIAVGVGAWWVGIFHLMTHAFFKACLFLGAGSVIIGMHHDQDIRNMGGLRKYMPITWITMWVGTLALTGMPFLSGFYSKDSIIEAAHHAAEHGGWVQQYGYWAVLLGVFVTSFYSFRLLYLTFHGQERFRHAHGHHGHDAHAHDDAHGHHGPVEPHESPWVVTLPLVLLAIPSLLVGFFTAGPMLFGDFFEGSIIVREAHNTLAAVAEEFHGAAAFARHGFFQPAFGLAFAGFALATYIYLFNPRLADRTRKALSWPTRVLENKYGFDTLWIGGFAGSGRRLGQLLWKRGDVGLIDGVAVNGSAWLVDRVAGLVRHLQSGYLYHYAFAMILGLIVLLGALLRAQS
ncbi:MAG: proton-conducting transporter membrane subunit, partial [Xanthomonadaceae bacterium]|nr:proton-conducting transporter membrane subunit [Xanthomonadaceae bacterium]